MNCSHCGTPLPQGAQYCSNCGMQAAPPPPPNYGGSQQYCQSCGEPVGQSSFCLRCGAPVQQQQGYQAYQQQPYATPYQQKSRIAAGLLGIFLGGLGIHNFYLGFTKKGLIQLLGSTVGGLFTFGLASIGIGIWAFVEAILILMGDARYSRDSDGRPLN